MSADAKLKAYIDRILRCREAEDEAKKDTKDVYAELAGEGYEKAIVGQVVTFLRKREKDGDKLSEQSAKFDLYLEAYERPSHAHTRVRAAAAEFQAKASGDNGATEQDIEDTADSVTGDASRSSRGDDPPATISLETATRPGQDVQSPSQRALAGENLDVTAGETATHSEKATVATQGEATAPTSDERETDLDEAVEGDRAAANAGGDDVDGGAERAEQEPTSKTGEGAASALPAVGYFIEDVPPSGMKRLPYAGCFPELTKAEYEKLEMDIADNGVDVSIIRQGDVIIDGWHRFIIARKYGLNYPIHQIELERDVLLDVIERQRASRNFTPAQEKKIAADLAKEFPHRADEIMAAFGLAEALEAAE